MPVSTIASAVSRMRRSSTAQPNLFHVLKPMGGTGARTVSTAAAVVGAAAGGSFPAFPGPHAARTAAAKKTATAAGGILLMIVGVILALSLGTCPPDYKAAEYPSQQEGPVDTPGGGPYNEVLKGVW